MKIPECLVTYNEVCAAVMQHVTSVPERNLLLCALTNLRCHCLVCQRNRLVADDELVQDVPF